MASWLTGYADFVDRFWWLWVAWPLVIVALSVAVRIPQGKPIFPAIPRTALYRASFASGRSRRNLLTMLGGASNCLLVGVTEDELIIVPFFPFNLMFLPEIYDLEHRVAKRDVISVETSRGVFSDSTVVRYRRDDGRESELQLRLSNSAAFESALT